MKRNKYVWAYARKHEQHQTRYFMRAARHSILTPLSTLLFTVIPIALLSVSASLITFAAKAEAPPAMDLGSAQAIQFSPVSRPGGAADPLMDVANSDPINDVTNMMTRLRQVISTHPRLRQSQQEICESSFAVTQERTAYYPSVNASLSAGNRFVNKTTRGDEFGSNNAPEYDGKGANLNLTLRQKIYDWGKTRAAVNRAALKREAAGLEGRQTLETQLGQFYQLAFDYVRTGEVIDELETASKAISADLNSIKKRFEAGAGRIAEVRAGQIIELDIESKLQSLRNQRAIAADALKTNFEVSGAFAEEAITVYRARRPEFPDLITTEETLEWRILDAQSRAESHEIRRLRAGRLPEFTGVLTGQAWDVTDAKRCGDVLPQSHPDAANIGGSYLRYRNCHTYELAGRVEMSLPLYDGGLNATQRNRAAARRNALAAQMAALDRSYRARSRTLNDTLVDLTVQIEQQDKKLVELRAQLASEMRVQAQTRRDPLALARLRKELVYAVEQRASLISKIEVTRVSMLAITHQLADLMDVKWELGGC